MAAVRLDKFVSSAMAITRSEAHILIKRGYVSLDGKSEKDIGKKIDPEKDKVEIDGKPLRKERNGYTYVMLNKPRGFLSSGVDLR